MIRPLSSELARIGQQILSDAMSNDYAGYDPFDGLNSKLFEWLPGLKKGVVGLAWTQLHKRSPVNLRPWCGVPKRRNPKGVALFILGLIEQYKTDGDAALLVRAANLADWLLSQQSDQAQWQHSCWGYHFDWNARAFFVPQGKPNVITTLYVARALYELAQVHSCAQTKAWFDAAMDAGHFIVNTLYTQHDGRQFFAYIPGETAFVHNASLWGAAWVAVVGVAQNNPSYVELALTVARQSACEQADDGSWVYGARHHHQFIDGFHTGYNLEALQLIQDTVQTSEFDQVIQRGLQFYKTHLLATDGTAKYYHDNPYPLDMHSVAQAVFTLERVGRTASDHQLAALVLQRALDTLYDAKTGHFYYQKTAHYTNRLNYIRWTQAWVYYAFAFFLHQQARAVTYEANQS